MQGYDATFKLLLKSSPRLMRELAGAPIVQWLEVAFPKVQNLRVDLLGENALGELAHLELQEH